MVNCMGYRLKYFLNMHFGWTSLRHLFLHLNISLRRKLLLITRMKKDEYPLDFEVNTRSGGMLTEKKGVLPVNCVKLYVPRKQLL